MNILPIAVAALVTLPVGFLWYHKNVFGNAWIKTIGLSDDDMKKGPHMAVVFLLTYVMSFIIAFAIRGMVIHQASLFSILANNPEVFQPGAKIDLMLNGKIQDYEHNFRTFKHGVLHGVIGGLLFVTPIFTINALFEKKGFKYIAINGGYWIVCLALMGGIICGWE